MNIIRLITYTKYETLLNTLVDNSERVHLYKKFGLHIQ